MTDDPKANEANAERAASGLELTREGPVAFLWLDRPDARHNTLSISMIHEFDRVLTSLGSDPDVRAVVIASRKRDSFIVGADIAEFKGITNRDEVERQVRELHRVLARLEGLGRPTVAAIHGPCVGGGLELALACTYRLASDSPKTKLALPEVNLGLLPGGGGTQRLPRLVGVQAALEMMLTGRNIYAKPARRMGLVDALIHPPGLLAAAKRVALELASGTTKPRKRTPSLRDTLLERTPLNRFVYRQAEETVQKKTRGLYPAPSKIIDCVRTGLERGTKAGLDREAKGFADLLVSSESRALVNLFFLKNAAERNPHRDEAQDVDTVAVLGAGLMGSGIAEITLQGGMNVLLKDRDLALAARGKRTVFDGVTKRIGRGVTRFERDQRLERLRAVERYDDLAGAQLVIEAVLEDLELKRQVLADVESHAPDAIFASNTSSIPIAQIAASAARPERVLGMHYFSPAQKMPLLEIITTDRTSQEALATAFDVGLRQGKTIIAVADRPGFYVNRVLAPYMDEALRILADGASVDAIDDAMTAYGFPVGPLKLLDEVGFDVGSKVTEVLRPLFEERGIDLMHLPGGILEAGILGRKSGRGFYLYEGKRRTINPDVYGFFGGPRRKDVPRSEIQERLAYALMNEAMHCLGDGVIARPQDGDVGAVFGIGYPPFRGGPFWHADELGARAVFGTLERLRDRHGLRYDPAKALREVNEGNTTFYERYGGEGPVHGTHEQRDVPPESWGEGGL